MFQKKVIEFLQKNTIYKEAIVVPIIAVIVPMDLILKQTNLIQKNKVI